MFALLVLAVLSCADAQSASSFVDVTTLARPTGAGIQSAPNITVNNRTGQINVTTSSGVKVALYEPLPAVVKARSARIAGLRLNTTAGSRFAETGNGTTSRTESAGRYDYASVLDLSFLFYAAQRSGVLPASNPISWRTNALLQDATPGGQSLAGGHFDAGDHLKLNFPAAFALSLIAWSYVDIPSAYAGKTGTDALSMMRWQADFFVACHYQELAFVAQVGDPGADHSVWVPPEQVPQPRPSYAVTPSAPGTDLLAAVSASLAATSMAFAATDPAYATQLLAHARDLYTFADEFRGKYSDSIPQAAGVYPSSGFEDDLAFAAVWLYRATLEQRFLTDARTHFGNLGYVGTVFSWDDVSAGVALLLATTAPDPSPYLQQLRNVLDAWRTGSNGITLTPKVRASLSHVRQRFSDLPLVLPYLLVIVPQTPNECLPGSGSLQQLAHGAFALLVVCLGGVASWVSVVVVSQILVHLVLLARVAVSLKSGAWNDKLTLVHRMLYMGVVKFRHVFYPLDGVV